MSKPLAYVRTASDTVAMDAMSGQFGTRQCQECGGPVAGSVRRKRFCATKCRMRFNKRREARGAQLYDLYMAGRYERTDARADGVQSQMNRLCMYWRTEDDLERGGRFSWGDWRSFLRDMPCLRVERILGVQRKK